MSVVSYVGFRFTAEGAERAAAVMREALADTAAFPGCEELETLTSADPTHLVVREVWASRDAESAYRAWRATPEGAIGGLAGLTAAPALVEHVEG